MRKNSQLNVRVSPTLKARVESLASKHGLPISVIITACLEAYCDYVERTGSITLPLKLTPKIIDYPEPKSTIKMAAEKKLQKKDGKK